MGTWMMTMKTWLTLKKHPNPRRIRKRKNLKKVVARNVRHQQMMRRTKTMLLPKSQPRNLQRRLRRKLKLLPSQTRRRKRRSPKAKINSMILNCETEEKGTTRTLWLGISFVFSYYYYFYYLDHNDYSTLSNT